MVPCRPPLGDAAPDRVADVPPAAILLHELRTPLNAIVGFATIIRMEGAAIAAPRLAQCVAQIELAGRHMLHLVEEFALAQQPAAVASMPTVQAGDLVRSLTEAVRLIGPAAARADVQLALTVHAHGAPRAPGSEVVHRQVFLNLLSNALKFTPAGGRVTADLHVEGQQAACRIAIVDVTDTGIGMSEDQQHRLFQPYERLGRTLHEGSGIGLFATRRLLQALGGEIRVHSREGEGTRFSVRLPLCADDPGPAA